VRVSGLVPRVRLGLRARLGLIYGTSFLAAGVILIGAMHMLMASNVKAKITVAKIVGVSADGEPGLTYRRAAGPQETAVAQKIVAQREDLVGSLMQSSVVTLVALCLLATVLGYLVAGRTLRPLQTVTATARRLSESTLHERIGLTGPPDEIKELADTFDGMLDRLHRAFDSQRRFIANASHELRTPLAISRAAIEVALAKPAVPDETRALAAKLLVATARHERLIEGLLLLARSEREVRTHTLVDVRDAAATAIGQLTTAAADADVTIHADLGPAPTSGDPVLLERCVVNLVENAVKHNVPGGTITVRTDTADGWACVSIANTGPPLTPAQAEAAFEPFTRLTRAHTPGGAGLGLSIVRAVTAAHHGRLHADPRPDGGLTVTIELPPPVRTELSEPALTSSG